MKTSLKQRLKILICVAVALAITITYLPVSASEDELIQTTDELQTQLATLDQELLAISDEIDATALQIEITHAEIIRTEHNLELAIADEVRQFEEMKIRIRYIYEMSSGSFLEFLFASESITDFLNRAEFIQTINAHDREMLDVLVATQLDIQEYRDGLVVRENSLIELGKELEEQRLELTARAAATATDLDEFLAQLEWIRAEEQARIIEEATLVAQIVDERPPDAQETPGNITPPETGNEVGNNEPEHDPDPDPDPGEETPAPPPPPPPPPPPAAGEVVLFAALLEAEAFQNYTYLMAVATVIMNRVADPRFPGCITSVIHQPGQFSPTWNGSLDRILARGPTALSLQVAQDAVNGGRCHILSPAHVFFNTAGISSEPGINIGGNVFWTFWPSW